MNFQIRMNPDSKSQPINILLVEDDDGDAKGVIRAFRKAGIANPVVRAVDGLDALSILRDDDDCLPVPPFLVIVDINMPRMNGHELVARLRADPRLKKLVVFMLTTSRLPEDIDAAYDNHVAGYIVKETAGADFLQLVSTLDSYWRLIELPEIG